MEGGRGRSEHGWCQTGGVTQMLADRGAPCYGSRPCNLLFSTFTRGIPHMRPVSLVCALALAVAVPGHAAQPKSKTKPSTKSEPATKLKSETFDGLKFRSIGPATNSGRIADLAIHPSDPHTWYVAVASGGVWKTTNSAVTWTPLFDSQPSYSIGCVSIDPNDPLTVWVGTGENNSQRSVGYGDGVYRSDDGGKSWERAGLEKSEHIGKILIDPRHSNVVYVAAQGSLWAAGGDRGLYKTEDGGKTWTRVLNVDDWTGVSDLAFDPRNPDVIYATSYQRARRVWTLIDGGPGSAIWKSKDAGKTWKKLTNGLPKEDMGRIGIAVSPAQPDIVYAIIEAAASGKAGGVYRSTDAGGNWDKRGDHVSSSPQYYQELVCDPKAPDRVYSLDTFVMVSEDGGKTFRRAGEKNKHVDNHALWIDPNDTDHLIVGCDGGLYESYDRAANWRYVPNLPVTQFYKVAVDEAKPFYNVYGGTQDNHSMGGPSRTLFAHGAANSDWTNVRTGDGFQPVVDPTNPDIVYAEAQHGALVRYDRKTGERLDIQPKEEPGEPGLHWNWDSPLIISPHSPTRLYFAANRLYRTDDRGDTWTPVSPDLTRKIDRNRLEVMGRVWGPDAVAKNASTSFYGNIVALTESPRKEGLLYVGTDDGLVQVSEDGGKAWRKVEKFPGVPELTYVTDLEASRHADGTVYATFGNHKMGDFKPYVLKSTDSGRGWTSITGDLPERGNVWCIVEDPVNPKLLFLGTEFGLYCTMDGGRKWIRLKGGMPTISVRDLAIQKRENDLVVATFGRGFYVLDDYRTLRTVDEPTLAKDAVAFPVRDAWVYVPQTPLGFRGTGFQGETYYTAANPPFGAVFTYYMAKDLKTKKQRRQDSEKEIAKSGGDAYYPSWDSLRAEEREEDPSIVLTVTDADGNVVRRLSGPAKSGFQRVAWDLRYPAMNPTRASAPDEDAFGPGPMGPLAGPGTYTVHFAKRVGGVLAEITEPQPFEVEPLGNATLPATDRVALLEFQRRTARLQRAVLGAQQATREAGERITLLKKAIEDASAAQPTMMDDARKLEARLADLRLELEGDAMMDRRNESRPPSLSDRVNDIIDGRSSTSMATATQRRSYEIAAKEFSAFLPKLKTLVETDLHRLETQADAAGAPWTPGRVPEWSDR